MVTNDATILKIKHEVLYRVAKLAYDGEFEEKKGTIPYEMIPGPKAQFRCCIYKEREVIRQRVNLAEGKTPTGETPDFSKGHKIVYVIPSACEECPIARYTVTNNCQNCMGKACYNSCNFGAITIGMHQAYIDPSKCKECGKCAAACPYNAIADLMRPCRKSCPVDALQVDPNTGIAMIVMRNVFPAVSVSTAVRSEPSVPLHISWISSTPCAKARRCTPWLPLRWKASLARRSPWPA